MRAGLLLPLDDMLVENGIDTSTYVPSIVNPGDDQLHKEDNLYCLASYAGSVQMLYNKDMFDAAVIPAPRRTPMTPEQFIDYYARQLTDEANGVWGAAVSDPLAYIPWEVYFSDDGRTAEFNSPEAVQSFETLASGYDQGCPPTSNVLDPWSRPDFFAKGQLAMVITDFQDLPVVEEAINYGSTSSPTPTGYEPASSCGRTASAMADSDNPDEALDFIAYLTTQGSRSDRRPPVTSRSTSRSPRRSAGRSDPGSRGRTRGAELRPQRGSSRTEDVIGPYYDAWGLVLGGEKTPRRRWTTRSRHPGEPRQGMGGLGGARLVALSPDERPPPARRVVGSARERSTEGRVARKGLIARKEQRAAYLFLSPWLFGLPGLWLISIVASLLLSMAEGRSSAIRIGWAGQLHRDVVRRPGVLGVDQGHAEYLRCPCRCTRRRTGPFVAAEPQGPRDQPLPHDPVRAVRAERRAAVAVLWVALPNPDVGAVNEVLRAALTTRPGGSRARRAVPSVVLVGPDRRGAIIYLSGLQNIGPHLYEAALLDGAGAWQFRFVTPRCSRPRSCSSCSPV